MQRDDFDERHWDPTPLFRSTGSDSEPDFAVILLNQPIASHRRAVVKGLWERATLRLCADGGANRLYDAFKDDIVAPNEIRGDLDSIQVEVKEFYKAKGVKIVKAASQYATDLQKCILRIEEVEEARAIQSNERETRRMDVVIIGGLSGRFDQTMHTLHVLCQIASISEDTPEHSKIDSMKPKNKGLNVNDFVTLDRRARTWVLSENSLVWILIKGSHHIRVDQNIFGPTCGLSPFASQLQADPQDGIKIWTKGLKWDLDGTPSAVGSFLSTSNHLKEDEIQVTTEKEILWTMEIREDVQ